MIGLDRPTLERDVKKLGCGGIVVIDGAPQLTEMAVSAIKAAELAVIPAQPSQLDIWATSELGNYAKVRSELTEGRFQGVFVASRVVTNTRIGKEIFEALGGCGLPILTASISQRVIYAVSMARGETAMDAAPGGVAALEVKALADEVLGILYPAKEATKRAQTRAMVRFCATLRCLPACPTWLPGIKRSWRTG